MSFNAVAVAQSFAEEISRRAPEMESVRRPALGISTDSITAPSSQRQRNLVVPSSDSMICSTFLTTIS